MMSIRPALLVIAIAAAAGGAAAAAGEPEAVVRVCEPGARPAARGAAPIRVPGLIDRVICELDEPIVVRPVVRGPRHRGAIPYPRAPEEIGDELSWTIWFGEGPLRACYRWARWAKPDLAGDVTLTILVDEWGRLTSITPAATPPGGEEVAACFAQTLAGMQLGHYDPRRT